MRRLSLIPVVAILYCLAAYGQVDDSSGAGIAAFEQQRWSEAYEYLIPEAEQGEAPAQYYLSRLLEQGHGVEVDRVTALTLLLLSAEGGYPQAQLRLGNYFQLGHWVERDMRQAVDWWLKAAQQGVIKAQLNLAGAYFLADGVDQDRKRSLMWYRRAAASGSELANRMLRLIQPADGINIVPSSTQPGAAVQAAQDELEQLARLSLEPSEETSGEEGLGGSGPFIVTLPAADATDRRSPSLAENNRALAAPTETAQPVSAGERSAASAQTDSQIVALDNGVMVVRSRTLWDSSQADPRSRRWIERQPLNNYTLQLFSSNKYSSVQRFVGNLDQATSVAIFPFGKPESLWYGVIIGSYSTLQELQIARNAIVGQNGIKKPWIRRFEQIVNDYAAN